jgi:hypothetical protein
MAWVAEQIQSVLYTAAGSPGVEALGVFDAVIGGAPDSFKKAQGPLGTTTAQALVNGLAPNGAEFNFLVETQVGRLDLRIQAPPTTNPTPDDIEDVPAAIDAAAEALRQAVAKFPAFRTALVVHAVEVVPDFSAARDRLHEIVPFAPFIGEPVDFWWQVNSRVPFHVDAQHEYNRIVRYGAQAEQLVNFQLPTGPVQQAPLIVQERRVVTWTIDVNSHARSTVALDAGLAGQMVTELAAEAKAILDNGWERLNQHGN